MSPVEASGTGRRGGGGATACVGMAGLSDQGETLESAGRGASCSQECVGDGGLLGCEGGESVAPRRAGRGRVALLGVGWGSRLLGLEAGALGSEDLRCWGGSGMAGFGD